MQSRCCMRFSDFNQACWHNPLICQSPSQVPLLYLKPVQTGFPDDSDARLVVRPQLMLLMTMI